MARRWAPEKESLGGLRDVPGVEPTKHAAERAHRLAGLWRKRSQGPCSAKGTRGVERGLALRHTCRIRGRPLCPPLVAALTGLFKGETPELSGITQYEGQPAWSTPWSHTTYVVQRLATVYGRRQDMLEDVLMPGVLDALGGTAGTALLRAALPELEAEAERMRQDLGVDVQQPLVQLIRTLAWGVCFSP